MRTTTREVASTFATSLTRLVETLGLKLTICHDWRKKMKRTVAGVMILLATSIVAVPTQAQCPNVAWLKWNDIRSALGGNWACAQDGSDVWNEQIVVSGSGSSGTFRECHSGLTTGPDPIDDNKGTYTLNNNSGTTPDTISYTYPPSGGSYTYQVHEVAAGSQYTFCRVSDDKIYTVYITTCPPPTLNSCP